MSGKVTAMGIWAAIQILHGTGWAGGVAAPDTVVFGPVRIGWEMMDTVRIQNRGATDLLVLSAGVSGPAYDLPGVPFSGAPVALKAGGALSLPIRFAPADTGRAPGHLDVAIGADPLRVALDGEGVTEVVVIDEILADPPSGAAGDANGDGVRNSNQDEFVEILNIGLRPIEMSGWQLCDRRTSASRRFAFPQGTRLGPGERAVLFGGGTPTGIDGQVFVDDGKIGGGLSNSGDAVYLIDPSGPDTLARAAYGSEGGRDVSLVRHPEGRGALVKHSLFPGDGSPFSPGRPRIVLDRIEAAPSDTSIGLGETVVFASIGRFTDGSSRELEQEAAWRSSDPSVLMVGDGVGQALGLGDVVVTVSAGEGISSEARVRVTAPGIASLILTPAETLLVAGDSMVYAVEGAYPDSTREPIDGGVHWATSDTSVARPTGGGGFLAAGAGVAAVSAFVEALSATASMRVADVGDVNADGAHDLLDAVRTVHLILGEPPPATRFERCAADLNGDGGIDILDLAGLIRRILRVPAGSAKAASPGVGTWKIDGTVLRVETPVALRALFLEVGGPAEKASLIGDIEAHLAVRRTPRPSLLALIYTLADGGMLCPDGGVQVELSMLGKKEQGEAEGMAEDIDVMHILGADIRGKRVEFEEARAHPDTHALHQNRPNPFNASTAIQYVLPEEERVVIRIFSSLGQEVARLVDGTVRAGVHRISWDGRDANGHPVASGVYLCCLEAGVYRAVVKMVLLR